MVKFLIGLITGVLLVFLAFIFLVFILFQFSGEAATDRKENSVLVLRLDRRHTRKASLELPAFLGGGGSGLTGRPSLDDVTEKQSRAISHIQGHRVSRKGSPPAGADRGDPRRPGAVPQVRQAGLRVPAGARRRPRLPHVGPGCRPHYLRSARAG